MICAGYQSTVIATIQMFKESSPRDRKNKEKFLGC
jgi:hypothetical protein